MPWKSGDKNNPGQYEILDEYRRIVKSQVEARQYALGEITEEELTEYTPGSDVPYIIRIPKGYNTGGTKIASGIVNHFFDCFQNSITQTYAPTHTQIKDLLWKEIFDDRRGKGLPGTPLEGDLRLKGSSTKHFAKGRATQNAKGKGQESIQGQHAPYLCFVVDEAEGVEDFVYKAIDKMGSSVGGGVVIVILLANPRTRSSTFYRYKSKPEVINMRLSCLVHPNVVTGKPLIPDSVSRKWVNDQLEKCEIVSKHNPEHHTLEVSWRPGVIYRPTSDFIYSVLGETPEDSTADTAVPVGVYESAVARGKLAISQAIENGGFESDLFIPDPFNEPEDAWLGVDVARFGTDHGTVYVRWNGILWRAKKITKRRESVYVAAIEELIDWLVSQGVKRLRIRIDGSGGFGVKITEDLQDSLDLMRLFDRIGGWYSVNPIHFGQKAQDRTKYATIITQLYFEAAESLKGVILYHPPNELDPDLTDRRYEFKNEKGRRLHYLEEKKVFKKRNDGRSPDDGDGAVLALALDYVVGDSQGKRARVNER